MTDLVQAQLTEIILFPEKCPGIHQGQGRQQFQGVVLQPLDGPHQGTEPGCSRRLHNEHFRIQGGEDGHQVGEKIRLAGAAHAVFRHFVHIQAPVPIPQDLGIQVRFPDFIFKNGKIHLGKRIRQMTDEGGFSGSQEAGDNEYFHGNPPCRKKKGAAAHQAAPPCSIFTR